MDYSQFFSAGHIISSIILGLIFIVAYYLVMFRLAKVTNDEKLKKTMKQPKYIIEIVIILFVIGFIAGICIPMFFEAIQYLTSDIKNM